MSEKLYEKKKFFLTNTLSGKREEFKPAHPPKVLFYSCGPTVYGPLHIGNARALIYADLLYRWLRRIGYDVNFVRNYTDVDDKIIVRSNEEKISALEVAEKYIDYCETDIKLLGLDKPSRTVRVTESMPDILKMIQNIIDRGHAYVVDGEVLFSIDSFKEYGKLSGKKVEDLQAGARVEVDAKKRNPMDFSLWKPHKPGEPFWESPWSKGRPGWHIECSAMVSRWLGDTIDLHHGGQDLIFPHHENEIAQSEAANGKTFCSHWVHHAFLTSGNEKMSKSLGNILTIRDFIEKYSAEFLKYIYLSFHYRSAVPYTEETMTQALNELERVYLAKKWAKSAAGGLKGKPPFKPENDIDRTWLPLVLKMIEAFNKIEDELFADLNTPGALGHLFTLIREMNRTEGETVGKFGGAAPHSEVRAVAGREFLDLIEKQLYPLFNVFGENPDEALGRIEAIRRARAGVDNQITDEEIQKFIQERADARKNKDFKRADEIRKHLDAIGIVLVDSPQGTTWKAKA